MRYRFFYWVVMLGLLVYSAWVSRFYAADETSLKTISAKSSDLFEKQIQPLLVKTCGKCHGQRPKNSDLDLVSFGTAKAISRAGLGDLEKVPGINAATAKLVYDHFNDRS